MPVVSKRLSPVVLGIIKAVEYGCLAGILAWMVKRKQKSAAAHAATGLGLGVLFAAIVLGYTYWTNFKLFSAADVILRGSNEVLFPVGCSLVLFATEVWSKKWKSAEERNGEPSVKDAGESVAMPNRI
jgi:amino acid transporter